MKVEPFKMHFREPNEDEEEDPDFLEDFFKEDETD